MNERYRVTDYSDGLWCLVDSTKFIDEKARAANWPMQLHYHPLVGNVFCFKDKADAQTLADKLNEHEEHPQCLTT